MLSTVVPVDVSQRRERRVEPARQQSRIRLAAARDRRELLLELRSDVETDEV